MKSLGPFWRASFPLLCACFVASCGASDSDEPHHAGGGSSAGRATNGGSGGSAGSGQVTTGGTSGAVTGGAPSGGASGAGAAVAGGGMGAGAGTPATGGVSGAAAGSGGSSGGAGGGGSSGGGAPGGWTCENFGAEICFCRLGGDPLAGLSCTGTWNCCFVTGTAERGNCQCFDTASDAECTETVAGVMGMRAQACPP